MVMKIANRNNGDAGVLMKPEGAVKVVVLNGSRQIDQVVAGAGNNGEAGWVTQKVLPENGLPKGIHQLHDATNPAKNVHPQSFGGQVLHVDQKHVYQFGPKCGMQIKFHPNGNDLLGWLGSSLPDLYLKPHPNASQRPSNGRKTPEPCE